MKMDKKELGELYLLPQKGHGYNLYSMYNTL